MWTESHSVVSDSLRPHGLYSPWNSPGQNTGVGSLSLLQGIFPTQGSNPGLPHYRRFTSWATREARVPHELSRNFKNIIILKCCLLLFHNNEPFLNRIVMCNKKWIVYNNQWQPPQWLVQENAPKYFPKPNFHQKTVTVSLVVCCLSDPRQLSESWGNHYIWEVHSVNQWDTLKIPTPAALSHWQFCSVYFSICV